MTMMTKVEARELQWFATRMKRPSNPGRRTCVLAADYETYRNRAGQMCKRRLPKTGQRVFVPELLARRAGFSVFLPVKKDWRQINRCRPDRQLVTYPLLVDWMFVGWPVGENRFHDLMDLNVVVGVLGMGGRPLVIPEARVIGLMQQWGGGVLSPDMRRYMRKGAEFCVGDQVRVVAGPLAEQDVRVVDIKGPETRAVLQLFGGDIEVDIATNALEGVGLLRSCVSDAPR